VSAPDAAERPDRAPTDGAGRPIVLGLDTATPATVAGATAPDGRSAARIALPGPGERPGHTRLLLGLAEECLAELDAGWGDVGRLVLGLGPGTFTGIRVGVATGRSVALATGAELVGVETPAALAEAAGGAGAPWAGRPVLVVQDARRRELFVSLHGAGGDHAALARPWTVPQDGLAAAVAALPVRPAVAVGDGAVPRAGELRDAGVEVPDEPHHHEVDGVALIRAGARIAPVEQAALRPVYVRDADAVPTAERR
jgi:tRNA threonylcarbamoyladenosine biosynthesis protein TsaB